MRSSSYFSKTEMSSFTVSLRSYRRRRARRRTSSEAASEEVENEIARCAFTGFSLESRICPNRIVRIHTNRSEIKGQLQ
jgi:transposase